MFSHMPNQQRDISAKEHSYLDFDERNNSSVDNTLSMEDRLCPGCKKSVVSDNGGLVVAFGQSFFHVDCFKCAKCGNQVTADTNLLLLSDGSPICANCSYSCSVCHLPILDEAIMTGDDSYHAHCFKCKVCKNRIDELVFAKTTQGIYCMNCHSERMIKIRRHAQKKAEREKAAGGSGSSRTREQEARNFHRENGIGIPSRDTHAHPHPASPRMAEHSHPANVRSSSGQSANSIHEFHNQSSGSPLLPSSPQSAQKPRRCDSPRSYPLSVTVAPPETVYQPHVPDSMSPRQPVFTPPASEPTPPTQHPRKTDKQNTLPIPPGQESDASSMKRRKSYDDGVRPLDLLFTKKRGSAENPNPSDSVRTAESTNVAKNGTTGADNYRSKNPGLVLSSFNMPASSNTPSLSPSGPKSPVGHTYDSHAPSPLREQFSEHLSPARTPVASPINTPISTDGFSNFAVNSPEILENPEPHTPISREGPANPYLSDHATPTRAPRPAMTADKVPPSNRRHSRITGILQESVGPAESAMPVQRSLSPNLDPNALLSQRSFDDRPRSQLDIRRLSSSPSSSRSNSITRPDSPAHRADVPRNVESGTDTESEAGHSRKSTSDHEKDLSPAQPPTNSKNQKLEVSTSDIDPDVSNISQTNSADGSDDMLESSPVQSASHATYIAPALPPIRFSMSGTNFSELLGPAGPSLKTLEQLAEHSDDGTDIITPTPPSTGSSFDSMQRPISDVTIIGSHDHGSSQISLLDNDDTVVWKGDESTVMADTLDLSKASMIRPSRVVKPSASSEPPFQPRSILHSGVSDSSTILSESSTRITLTETASKAAMTLRRDTTELVTRRLQEVLADATDRGAQQLKLDKIFVEAIMSAMEHRTKTYLDLKGKFDGMKRTSKQYIEGLTVAQTEYDKELKARRDAEAEVTRLRILISGQAARLTALSGDARRHDLREQLSRQLHDNLTELEKDLSKIKVERDMTLAEIDELLASKSASNNSDISANNLSRSLAVRFDNLRSQYQHDLIPLTQRREALTREIAELKSVRDIFLEETTVLNARNEELAQLSAQYTRRVDTASTATLVKPDASGGKKSTSFDKPRSSQQHLAMSHPLSVSASRSGSYSDDTVDSSKYVKIQKQETPEFPTPSSKRHFMKWGSKPKEVATPPASDSNGRGKAFSEHVFQQVSILRFTRCDHCGEKMWGSQVRCTLCNVSVHGRCMNSLLLGCFQHSVGQNLPSQPSMFGRDLIEQVRADAKGGQRQVPVIVEKCIEAVEVLALDYEGIYRKTGGSGQSKAITHLFELGDYHAFDLRDSDRFNDICSITSVLKTYLRSLPVPLLTFDLHDGFMRAIEIRDITQRNRMMIDLVNKLPDEHYYTLRTLMLHLNHVMEHSQANLMTARNLGVVFGPTLMRSRDPAAEFSDMAGKALSVQWLVENASLIFEQS